MNLPQAKVTELPDWLPDQGKSIISREWYPSIIRPSDDCPVVCISLTIEPIEVEFRAKMCESNRPRLEPIMSGGFGIGEVFILLFAAVVLAASVFWVLMIIECATKEPAEGNDKLIWILIIIFTHWIGALIYYFIRRPQRIAQFGA
jgi:hypothetical protein